ncbi:MAG: energy-coupling factor transporter transmembrane protein EcfT, partial [Actinomycetota bacterium]|nr:energy-coupling factor transporter transmembrane protein EcfT [Actinomycetota bacterium]
MRTLGQFYPIDSPVHALDPRAKILTVTVLAVGLFVVGSLVGFLVVGAALALCIAASRIPPRVFFAFLRPVLPIVVATALFQALFSREGEVLFEWGFLEVRDAGLRLAAFLALRILLLVGAAGLLTATTSP